MEISGASPTLTNESLGTVQGQVQVNLLRKQRDLQQQQAQQLIESIPTPAQPGQPGALINTFA